MKKFAFPLLLLSHLSFAQTGLLLDAGLSKKWNKSLKSSIELGYRQNFGKGFDRIYADFGQAVKLIDGLKISAAYRLVLNEKGDQLILTEQQLSNRFQLGIDFDILDAFDIGSKRLQLSLNSTQQWGLEAQKRTNSIWRNKITFGYDIKHFPITPFVSAEHFYRWNANVTYTATDVIITGETVQWRYFIGASFELPKQHSLKIQFGLRDRASGVQAIMRASYQYNFK